MLSSQIGNEPKGIDDALNAGIEPRIAKGVEAEKFLSEVAAAAGKVAEIKMENESTDISFEWPDDPQELPAENPLPEFTEDDIPTSVRSYVVRHAHNLQVPLSFVVVSLIGAFGSLLGSTLRIQPKEHDAWLVCLNFWYLIIGPPSVRKSPAEKVGAAGLAHVARLEDEEYAEKKKEWATTEAKLKAQRDGLIDRIKSLSSGKGKDKKGAGTVEDAEAMLKEVDASLGNAPRPYVVMTNDATTEKLAEIEAYNRNGVTLKRDEIVGWMSKLEGTDAKGDRQFYLEGFEGGNRYRMDRVTRDAPSVPSHTISIGGTSQPGPIKQMVKSAAGLTKQNDGFTQRFSLTVAHPFPEITKYVDERIDPTDEERLRRASVLVHQWAKNILNSTDEGYVVAKFTSDAQTEFRRIFESLQGSIHELADWPDLQAHLGKYPKLIPALSVIFAVIELAYENCPTPPTLINRKHLILAERWSQVLTEHSKWLYNAREGMISPSALALSTKIREKRIFDGMNLRTIYRHGWSNLKTEESLNAAIEELAEYGWCVVDAEQGARGAPGFKIRLHPKLRGENA